ncbi:MAG TPA: class I SAM-dependent methyltransferase [Pirellulales bacterium]|jgi:23S rRNA (cytosine1962-C5)-methyltransferase|nr:class I SAM-dependent methyltransferase [Pirellulales bacterium]
MFAAGDHQLVDFGQGRKLERFGAYLLDRPSPAAEGQDKADPQAWRLATARYDRISGEQGVWRPVAAEELLLPERWTVRHGPVSLELKPTDFGHLGVFPEQAANWDWIAAQIARAGRRLKVLNLFGYTGASTLAAASAGAETVHVDAARNTVEWARRNAALSGLTTAPIRWIHEDAVTFVRRELTRKNGYDAVILDPPSYGHGAKGQTWKIDRLPDLLADCGRLTIGRRCFILVTCHTPGFDAERLRTLLSEAIGSDDIECGPMTLATSGGRTLASGAMARTK